MRWPAEAGVGGHAPLLSGPGCRSLSSRVPVLASAAGRLSSFVPNAKDICMKEHLLILFLVAVASLPGAGQDLLTVSGSVVSESGGQPLPGVNILVKGTSRGTTTDAD